MEDAHFNMDFSTPEERSSRMRLWVERDIIKEPNDDWDKILKRHLESETMTQADIDDLLQLWYKSRRQPGPSGSILIRNIAMIPACFLAIGIVYWVLEYIFNWVSTIDSFWYILVSLLLFVLIGGAIFMLFAVNFVAYVSRISPSPQFAVGTVRVLSIINCLYTIISIWRTPDQYSGTMIFCAIVFSVMSIVIAINLVSGAKLINTGRE